MTRLPLVVAVLALTASAAPRVSLLKFTGPRAPPARIALAAALCQKVDCVEPELVTSRFLPDWQKAKAQSVTFLIEGTAARIPGTVELTLQVLQDGEVVGTSKVELPKEGLSGAPLSKLTDALLVAMGLGAAPLAPAPAPKAVTAAAPAAPPEVVSAPPREAPPASQYAFAGELGVNVYNRSFDYLGGRVPELRRYSLPLVALLNARLEWFPFASGSGALRGLGLEVAGNLAPWIRSAPPGSTNSLPTFTSRTDAAVQLRLGVASGLTLAPLLGLRFHTFTVMGETADGRQIDGLPNLAYLAVRAGVGADYRFAGRFTAFARVAALPLLSSGELISAAWFPRGGCVGVEATGGVGVKLFGAMEARLSFDWTRYMFWFDTNLATSTFYARGAFDQYLGVTALARFEL